MHSYNNWFWKRYSKLEGRK